MLSPKIVRSAEGARKISTMARPPRKFTLPQIRRRLKLLSASLAAISWDTEQTPTKLRSRVRKLLTRVEEILERWPAPPT